MIERHTTCATCVRALVAVAAGVLALWAVAITASPAAAEAQEKSPANDARPAERVVVVKPGDTLWAISEGRLGRDATPHKIWIGVQRIYALNRNRIGADPNLIFVGQKFALPRSLERRGAGRAPRQAPRQAREAAKVAHAGASSARPEAARKDRGAGSGSARAAGPAADRSGEAIAARTAKAPVAAHAQDAREGGAIPDEAAAHRVPALRRPVAGATPSSPASYLGGVRATVSSAVSNLMDALVTDDRKDGHQLLGWALILVSSAIGVFSIVLAIWRAIARHERENPWRRRVEEQYAADAPMAGPAYPRVRERPPGGTGSVRSEDPAGPTRVESKGDSSPDGLQRNAGSASSRTGSAETTKSSRTKRRHKMVGEDPKEPDRLRGWQIGGGLRRSIGAIPLRPDALDDVLAELKPRVEEELRSLAPVEGSRTLSDREYRQASALRDLLVLAQEHRGGEPARPPSEVEEEGARIIRNMKENIFHLKEMLDSLAENAAKDHLTGVYNRKGGEERLAEDVARASRGGESITLAVLDLDQLKEVNERWGHQAGDACLCHLINALESNIREGDWIARWGGDEFVVGFWNAKEPSTAEATLQRVAEYLERNPASLPRGQRGWVSFSAGMCIHRDGESAAELFLRADMALFEAKRKGRNRVITLA